MAGRRHVEGHHPVERREQVVGQGGGVAIAEVVRAVAPRVTVLGEEGPWCRRRAPGEQASGGGDGASAG
eukprot:7909735-Lingulodinium_polyedra.AAC.1